MAPLSSYILIVTFFSQVKQNPTNMKNTHTLKPFILIYNAIFMKQIFIFSLLFFAVAVAPAQSDFVPVGGTATGDAGSVTYTVGQIAVQVTNNGDKSVLEGVQQPYEIQTVGVDDYPGITLNAVVYPNPTQNLLNLRISNFEIPTSGLTAQLYDAHGRLLQVTTVSELETSFDLRIYPMATYQLRVLDGKRMLKTFKIVKVR